MKMFKLFIMLTLLASCSVKKAGAPTAPPVTENKVFNVASMMGEFCHSDLPKVFLWPTDNDGQTMSYEEQAINRQVINKHNDDLALFTEQKDLVQDQLDATYLPAIQASKKEFKDNKCYSLCDPEVAFFCDQTDDTVTQIEDGEWKKGETRLEWKLIRSCQKNQESRLKVQEECNKEYSEKFDPLKKKAGDAALALLQSVDIGAEENYFTDFSEVQYSYADEKLFISLKYGDLVYSTESADDLLKITDAQVDLQNGYLTFNINAINTEEDDRIYGQFRFDLEFIFTETGFRFDGDFILENYDKSNLERVGRVSMAMSREACGSKNTDIGRCE
ncbi:MAG: hypothetical protein HRT44_08250 [Bdellovibrionales bacterium]|nr:hypothetical protein [Bdellovibrionales bacterium]NQZ19230.1 hypothetical protein [Bdellovibrionales bacterium]